MRILSVGNRYPPWSLGGYEVSWADAVAALRARGHTVRVLSTRPDPTDRRAEAIPPDVHRELRWYWRAHAFPPLTLRACLALERENARTMGDQLRSFRPDAVMWWAMGGMSLSLIEQVHRAGLPALGAVGDDWMVYGPRVDRWTGRWCGPMGRLAAGAVERLTGVPARLALDRGARWAFNSQYTLQSARDAGWRLPEASVVHPGVDPVRFAPREPAAAWRWRLLYCGRLDERKGPDIALRALAELGEARLTLIGEGPAAYTAHLRAQADALGVGDRVRFGSADQLAVAEAYAACDALVFPVRWREPWGLVPLEAMAVGRPVLASRAGGGVAEYLRDGENCLQFEPEDVAGLAAAARRLAEDAPLRSRLVAGGHQTAARYTAQAFHDGLEQELQRLT